MGSTVHDTSPFILLYFIVTKPVIIVFIIFNTIAFLARKYFIKKMKKFIVIHFIVNGAWLGILGYIAYQDSRILFGMILLCVPLWIFDHFYAMKISKTMTTADV